MSKDTCSYHSTRPAVWQCGDCARHFCTQCVTITDADPAGPPRCTLCEAPLEYLGAGNAAGPFWSAAHLFFAMPLRGSGPVFLAFMGFLALIMPLGLVGLFVLLFAVAVGVKYCFGVLEAVAMGATSPPPLADAVSGDEHHLFLRFIAMLIVIGFVQTVAEVLVNPALGTAVAVLVTLVMPAMIILLAVDKEVGQALSPVRVTTLVFSIGWPYVLAVFLTNVISTGPYLIGMYFVDALSESVFALPVLAALTAYFAVVNFAMLGYLIFEHQGALGFVAGDPEEQRLPGTPENRRQQLMGEANVLVRESRSAEALEKLHQRRNEFADDLTFHQRHYELALGCRDAAAVARAADPYLELLMSRDGVDRALDVWRQAARMDGAFRPANPAIAHTLAEHAFGANRPREALALLVNLHKRAPDYGELQGAYELAARILREQGDTAKADELEKFTAAFLARRTQALSDKPGDGGWGNLTLSSLR